MPATPWRLWAATLNTVHGEDDIAYWLDPRGKRGVGVVADGVSATGGGGASYLAAQAFTTACRLLVPRYGLSFETLKKCLEYIDTIARNSDPQDARLVAAAKRRFYSACSSGGEPCTRPPPPEDLVEHAAPPEGGRRESPATTLLSLVFDGDKLGIVFLGDGVLLGVGTRREELWISWGALPQYFQGARVARLVEVGRGVLGHPVIFATEAEPGYLYALATDGVDPAALAVALASLATQTTSLEEMGNPAVQLLKTVREKVEEFDDDASLVVAYYYT